MQPPTDDRPTSAPGVELWGALRELMEPVAGVDLTMPTGEVWESQREGPVDTAGEPSDSGQ